MIAPVALGGVADHLPPIPGVEVHVDVGHLLAVDVEEPFEEQVVVDGVDVDDAQAVRDTRPRRAPSTRADADVARAGVAHEVGDDEEVRREPHRLHDAELELDPLEDLGARRMAVALLHAFEHQLTQVGVFVVSLGHREARQRVVAELDLDVGALRDQQRVVARLLVVAEEVAHLRRRLQIELLGVELEALRIVDGAAGLHTQQRRVRLGILPVRVVAVVGGEQGRAQVARQPDQLRVDVVLLGKTVVLQLDEERVTPEHVLEPRHQVARAVVVVLQQRLRHRTAETAARGDEALVMLLEQLEVDARLLVETVEVGVRRHLDEVAIPLRGFGEQREVVDVVVVATRTVEPTGGDHVRLGADHGREVERAGRLVEVEDAVHVAVVGDADRGLAVGGGGGDDVGDARRTVEHRELGVQVEVDERLVAHELLLMGLSVVHRPVERPVENHTTVIRR